MATHKSHRRHLLAALVVTVFVGAYFGVSTVPAFAHCPGTSAHDYAYGNRSLGSIYANAARSNIEWTQGNVCTSGVSHSVTVCSTGSCSKWAQVGWRYYNGYSEPKMYCEWGGGTYKLQEFTVSHATHAYKQTYDSYDKYWDCNLDSTTKYSYSLTSSGFSSGNYLVAQGENHQAHVQIGKVYSAKLLFSDMQYRNASSGSWPAIDITAHVSSGPYGADEPAVGQLRVWTNAH